MEWNFNSRGANSDVDGPAEIEVIPTIPKANRPKPGHKIPGSYPSQAPRLVVFYSLRLLYSRYTMIRRERAGDTRAQSDTESEDGNGSDKFVGADTVWKAEMQNKYVFFKHWGEVVKNMLSTGMTIAQGAKVAQCLPRSLRINRQRGRARHRGQSRVRMAVTTRKSNDAQRLLRG